MTTAKTVKTTLWLFTLLALFTAITLKIARRELTITRAAMEMPPSKEYVPAGLLPQFSGIFEYVGNQAADDLHPRWGTESRPSAALVSILQMNKDSELGKLIPAKYKLWDLLNEIYITGTEAAPSDVYRLFGKSIFLSEPIQQAGLCDYLERRVMPGLAEYLIRRDYGGARRLVSEMMAWIESFNPTPQLANDNPRLQGYINLFLRLDALLNDPITLHSSPAEAQRVVSYIARSEIPASATVHFLLDRGGELAAWGHYFAGQAEISRFNFSAATVAFGETEDKTANPRLKDIARLGKARSLFWGAKVGAIEKTVALATLHNLKKVIRPSFRTDLTYYTKELSS